MKIVLAADGSSYTKKALAFLVTHEEFGGADAEIVVVNVQPSVPPRVKSMVGAAAVNDYHREEAEPATRLTCVNAPRRSTARRATRCDRAPLRASASSAC